MLYSNAESRNNIFLNQKADTGAFLLASSDSYFTDENSKFENGIANVGGLG